MVTIIIPFGQKECIIPDNNKKEMKEQNYTLSTYNSHQQDDLVTKTIYMTYKKNIPRRVKERWLQHNPDYKIDFSLDANCFHFLQNNFNHNVSNLFHSIQKGMYKADLWRLCKLYKNGGVYADIDLVPHLNIDQLNKNITFYSCLSIAPNSIFQAFIVNFSKPNDPLLLALILSFLLNKPYRYKDGPTFDMYKCIKYMLNVNKILPETKYEIDTVKLKICIGPSKSNIKRIHLLYFPPSIKYFIKLHQNSYKDNFDFKIENDYLIIKRIDNNTGWDHNHFIDICFPSRSSFFFFPENRGPNKNWVTSFVTHGGKKILDSRDMDYYKNKGW
jgi:hypothetical protein